MNRTSRSRGARRHKGAYGGVGSPERPGGQSDCLRHREPSDTAWAVLVRLTIDFINRETYILGWFLVIGLSNVSLKVLCFCESSLLFLLFLFFTRVTC